MTDPTDGGLPPADPDDLIDGCELDFDTDADDDETAALRALFPGDVPDPDWSGVFDAP